MRRKDAGEGGHDADAQQNEGEAGEGGHGAQERQTASGGAHRPTARTQKCTLDFLCDPLFYTTTAEVTVGHAGLGWSHRQLKCSPKPSQNLPMPLNYASSQ